MKKAILILLLATGFAVGAQNFERTYPFFDEAYGDVVFAHDDGYTLAGLSLKSGKFSLFLIHTNMEGDTISTKHLDYGVRSLGLVRAVTDNEDNHYISFFEADSANLVKFSSDWQEVWRKKFDFASRIYQMHLTTDDNLVVSATGTTTYLIKLDTAGNIIWQTDPVSVEYGIPEATSITETDSGEIILYTNTDFGFGYTYPNNTIRVYSNFGSLIDSGYVSPHLQYSCGIISSFPFEGHLLSLCYTGRGQSYLVHHEVNGTIIRQKEIVPSGIQPTLYKYVFNNNEEVIAIGNGSNNELIIHGMNSEGDSLWLRIRNYTEDNIPFSIALCNDGGYIISGGQKVNGYNQPYLLKTDPWGGNSGLGTENNKIEDQFKVYPNPANNYVIFESQNKTTGVISVTDIYGRPVAEVLVNSEKTVWDIRGVLPGVYLYKGEMNKTTSSGKILIMR